MSTQRTVRRVTVVVETEGLSAKEHERRVTWVEKNIQDAGRNIDTAFVSMVLQDANGNVVGIFGSGKTPSDEVLQIAKELAADESGSTDDAEPRSA